MIFRFVDEITVAHTFHANNWDEAHKEHLAALETYMDGGHDSVVKFHNPIVMTSMPRHIEQEEAE